MTYSIATNEATVQVTDLALAGGSKNIFFAGSVTANGKSSFSLQTWQLSIDFIDGCKNTALRAFSADPVTTNWDVGQTVYIAQPGDGVADTYGSPSLCGDRAFSIADKVTQDLPSYATFSFDPLVGEAVIDIRAPDISYAGSTYTLVLDFSLLFDPSIKG